MYILQSLPGVGAHTDAVLFAAPLHCLLSSERRLRASRPWTKQGVKLSIHSSDRTGGGRASARSGTSLPTGGAAERECCPRERSRGSRFPSLHPSGTGLGGGQRSLQRAAIAHRPNASRLSRNRNKNKQKSSASSYGITRQPPPHKGHTTSAQSLLTSSFVATITPSLCQLFKHSAASSTSSPIWQRRSERVIFAPSSRLSISRLPPCKQPQVQRNEAPSRPPLSVPQIYTNTQMEAR